MWGMHERCTARARTDSFKRMLAGNNNPLGQHAQHFAHGRAVGDLPKQAVGDVRA